MVRFHETLPRSIAKAITFRILVITLDSVVVYLLTRRVDVTVGVVAISNLASTIAYILHERAWNRVHYGRKSVKKQKKLRR